MNKYLLLFIGFLCFKGTTNAQINYLSIRENVTNLTCTQLDANTASKALQNLELLDSSQIDSNMNIYLNDLANAYWVNASYTKDTNLNRKAVIVYHQLIHLDSNDFSAWWNMAFSYRDLDRCDLALEALEKYLAITPKEYIMMEEVNGFREVCK